MKHLWGSRVDKFVLNILERWTVWHWANLGWHWHRLCGLAQIRRQCIYSSSVLDLESYWFFTWLTLWTLDWVSPKVRSSWLSTIYVWWNTQNHWNTDTGQIFGNISFSIQHCFVFPPVFWVLGPAPSIKNPI